MLTVDYAFYTDVFRGTLEEEEFNRLSVFASAYVDELTRGRAGEELAEEARERVRLALCAVCEARAVEEQRDGIAGETNDGISVSYAAGGAGDPGRSRLYRAAAAYLAPTGLLYRGVNV